MRLMTASATDYSVKLISKIGIQDQLQLSYLEKILFVFVALRPMSTAMVIAGRSVHLTTLFLGRLEQAVNQ